MSKTRGRIITGTLGAYLTEYSGVTPADLIAKADDALIKAVSFSHHNMAPQWTRVGDATITIQLPPNDQIITGRVESLRAEQKKVKAEAQQRATEIEREIQSLLAITFEPETAR